jgi:hypothetical protein
VHAPTNLDQGLSIGLAATVSDEAMHGLGTHGAQLTPNDRAGISKASISFQCISPWFGCTNILPLTQQERKFLVD